MEPEKDKPLLSSQETRNKVYALVGSALAVLLIYGVVDDATSDAVLDLTQRILDLIPEGLGLITVILAWLKSRPSKVTVLNLPQSAVEEVKVVDKDTAQVLAGPASAAPTGTVLSSGPR
jgi:hypothetical protein